MTEYEQGRNDAIREVARVYVNAGTGGMIEFFADELGLEPSYRAQLHLLKKIDELLKDR